MGLLGRRGRERKRARRERLRLMRDKGQPVPIDVVIPLSVPFGSLLAIYQGDETQRLRLRDVVVDYVRDGCGGTLPKIVEMELVGAMASVNWQAVADAAKDEEGDVPRETDLQTEADSR